MTVRFVAELSGNHNGNFVRAVRLLDAATKSGFQAVKTQHFRADSIYSPEALLNEPGLADRCSDDMPIDWHSALQERANERGMRYGTTVFSSADVESLKESVDFFKVASYSLLDTFLLECVAKTKLPVIVSTGMSTMDECLEARRVLMAHGAIDITFLHCVSAYPCPPEQANLKAIDIMQKMLCWPIGWSDHTIFPPVSQRAVERWKASVIEVHFDLADGLGAEADHSYTPRTASNLIASLRDGLPHKLDRTSTLDGNGKKEPQACELKELPWRADPSDGHRPRLEARKQWTAKTCSSSSLE
jgi:N-acetylneuraminate synthase